MILENIDIDIDIDKAILQNIDIDKISNRFKFGILNRARSGETSWPTTMAHHPHVRQTVLIMLASACIHACQRYTVLICLLDSARMRTLIIASGRY